ncbi:MAG TPA: type IV toxin-antitoxin system AbiEi family antitoxin domain-containing protein [Trebonia sp.]|jgi:hypothetical protein|nr:type IV toxin-antitoxin system AbiEi family antitoxin domain-containing protein [Trebonia sp.]
MLYHPPEKIASTEGEWALVLSAQKKLVSLDQARALGMSRDAILWKVRSGRWQRVYRGVYATFTGDLSREQRLWAVILRIGDDDAVLSHETAAELQDFSWGTSTRIHVTVPLKCTPTRWNEIHDVVIHRSGNIRADAQPWFRLPRTPIWDTVLDLAESAGTLDDAYGWLSRAITKDKVHPGILEAALKARKKVHRRGWIRDALTDVSDGIHFPLERRWSRDVERAHGLPRATRQSKREGADGIRYLDNLYEPWGLSVELDGRAFHPPEDRDNDRYRDNETSITTDAAVLRYGFKQVANRPCEQAAQFARALVKHGWAAATLKPCEQGCPVGRPKRQRPWYS